MTHSDDPLSQKDEDALEAFFTAARANEPVPSADFLGRVLGDAQAHMPQPKPSWWTRFRRSVEPVGGLPGMTALAASAMFGLGFGYAGTSTSLDGLLEPISSVTSFNVDEAVDLFSIDGVSYDDLEG